MKYNDKNYLDHLIGKKFHRLTVIKILYSTKQKNGYSNQNRLICKCDCGNIKEFNLYCVTRKGELSTTKSCGCLNSSVKAQLLTTHGLSKHPLYKIWDSIKQRCFNPRNCNYKRYGARGITMCPKWIHNPNMFITWALKNGYKKGLEIDRKNNNGNYSPQNCRFVTDKVNSRNRRTNIFYYYKGENKTVCELAEILNINYHSLRNRLRRGWDLTKAVGTPTRCYRK